MENEKLNVLILAAGLGTRLRPLTEDMPKPLVPVVDKSILEIQALRARELGNVRLHANAHYLAEQVIAEGSRLGFEKVWEEPEILGTAGPLKRIYNEGYRGGLLVMNGDAYCRFDLNAFMENARNSGCDVALLAVEFPQVNTFRVDGNGHLAGVVGRFGSEDGKPATPARWPSPSTRKVFTCGNSTAKRATSQSDFRAFPIKPFKSKRQ